MSPWIPNTQISASGGGGDLTKLEDVVLGVDTASFDVTGISQDYLHLYGFINARGTLAAQTQDTLNARFNNDSGTNYSGQAFSATGSSLAASGATSTQAFMHIGYIPAANALAGGVGSYSFWIPDYTSTDFFKTIVVYGAPLLASFFIIGGAGQWEDLSPVTQITFFPGTPDFLAGSRLTIYGMN
jgi:hypothetical protein